MLVIPPDLLSKLSKNSSYRQLLDDHKVRFSTLQYLTIKEPQVKQLSGEMDELCIELENYVLLSPDALPLDDKYKEQLQKAMAKDPLSLIEYWSVDPDYDGETFRSAWQDYRENNSGGRSSLKVAKTAKIPVAHKEGRKVCVKAVDVFGFESVVVREV